MECTEARRLIDQGVTPGLRTPHQSQLGFHLAGCPACRAYREQHHALLAELLHLPPTAPPPAQPAPPPPAFPSQRRSVGRLFWLASLLLLIGLPLAALIWGVGVWLRTEQHIAALIVTPAPLPPTPVQRAADGMVGAIPPLLATPTAPTPTATATLQRPTATPRTTPTPWPTLQPAPPTPTPEPPTPAPPPPGDAATILLLGNDRRPGETDIPRTDAIMLIRVEPQRQRVALLSLPRDLFVTVPGYGQTRINAAYVWGENYGAPGGGLALAQAAVSNLLGLPIDYVVMADFEGFIGLIDALGGITVDVEKELYDNAFPTMDYGYTVAHFLPGPQQMDGVAALTYSRIRHPDSDFMRIRRQQTVLLAIADRVRERGDLLNAATADQITGALVGFVQTDMPRDRIVGLLWALRNSDAAAVERYTLDESMVSFGVGGDRYALVPLNAALAEVTRRFMGAP